MLKKNNYAPIALSTYSRINHLKQAVEKLKENTLSPFSHLYIFSDAPKPGDEKKILEVRNYLKTITGFKTITIIERETNSRINNNRGGINFLLNKYGKVIYIEEDIICAPGFLSFVNIALEKFEHNPVINSISGYVEPFKIPDNYPYDAFFTHRFNAWGFAIWKDRFVKIPDKISKKAFAFLLKNRNYFERFKYFIGEDAIQMLNKEVNGKIDALDVRLMFHQFTNNLLTVRPARSLTQNIGHDGSGSHCIRTNRFDVEPWDKTGDFVFPDTISINRKYANRLSLFRRVSQS